MLDRLHSYAEAMPKLAEQLEEGTIFTRRRILQEAEKVLEAFATTGWKNSLKSGHLQKIWDECFPESWWSDSGSPAYSQVARMITILMGSFPTSKIPEPEIFVRALIEDVMEFDPSFVVLESTCRQLRKTQKFMPSISEVIEALQEQQKLWRRRGNTMGTIAESYDDLCAEVARAKAADAPMIERRHEAPIVPIGMPDDVEVGDQEPCTRTTPNDD